MFLQECLVEGPEMGGKVFCPTIGVDDPVIDVGTYLIASNEDCTFQSRTFPFAFISTWILSFHIISHFVLLSFRSTGPIRKAKRKRKRKPSFGSTGPRLNQKLVSSVGYIHCRYPRKEKANKANSIKKLKWVDLRYMETFKNAKTCFSISFKATANQRPVMRSPDLWQPIRGQYSHTQTSQWQ